MRIRKLLATLLAIEVLGTAGTALASDVAYYNADPATGQLYALVTPEDLSQGVTVAQFLQDETDDGVSESWVSASSDTEERIADDELVCTGMRFRHETVD